MANPTLLADLAWRLASSPEDVATEALTLILGRSDAARAALNGLLGEWAGSDACAVARWKSQVVGDDDCRTDMEGEDVNGVVRVIFENKFWAGLTLNQPAAYLERLPENGVLAFIAPAARLNVLVPQLVDRADRAGYGLLAFRSLGVGRLANVSPQRTLLVTSWDAVLSTIASALEAAQDHSALADLRQLQGLAEKMDTEGFLPLTTTDLTGANGKRFLQFCRIVDDVHARLARHPFVNTRGLRVSAGAGWYGPYVRIHGYGCQLMFSAKRWLKYGVSPIWFRVSTDDWRKVPDGLHGPLAAALLDPTWLHLEDDSPGLWLPLRLLEGSVIDDVVADAFAQLERVASVLGTRPLSRITTEPPAVSGL